jgi:hypothetical protein
VILRAVPRRRRKVMALIDEALSANATIARGFDHTDCGMLRLIQKARSHPWISPDVPVRGFVYDVSTGRLSEVLPE